MLAMSTNHCLRFTSERAALQEPSLLKSNTAIKAVTPSVLLRKALRDDCRASPSVCLALVFRGRDDVGFEKE